MPCFYEWIQQKSAGPPVLVQVCYTHPPQKKLDLHPIPGTPQILTQSKKITQLIVSPRHSGLCVLRGFEFLDVFRAGTAHLGREMRPEVGTDPRNHVGSDHTPTCFAESPMAEKLFTNGSRFSEHRGYMGPDFPAPSHRCSPPQFLSPSLRWVEGSDLSEIHESLDIKGPNIWRTMGKSFN